MGEQAALAHADLVGEAGDGEALDALDGREPTGGVEDRLAAAFTVAARAPRSLGARCPGRGGHCCTLERPVVLSADRASSLSESDLLPERPKEHDNVRLPGSRPRGTH